jgi:ABC-type transporter Mla maintaining outer membrane lipid asymmetry ATPase subunit MlaF
VLLYQGRIHFAGTAKEAMASTDTVVRDFFGKEAGIIG